MTSIGSSAFQNATSLSTITLPNSLTTIGTSAFQSSGLTSIDLSGTKITSIQNNTFNGAASLASVTLPTGLTNIGNNAFANSGISSLNLGDTQVNTIGQGAFANTTKLETLNVPSTLTTINSADSDNNRTFQGSAIKSLDLKNTQITQIQGGTFSGAASLATVKLPATVTTIGNKAFQGTTALTTLTQGDEETSGKLNDKITSINTLAFANSGLVTIDLSETKVTSFGNGTFLNMPKLATLKLPNTVTEIPSGLVAGSTNLTSFAFPTSLNKINDAGGDGTAYGAFQGTGLTDVDLSSTGLTA